MSKQDENGRIDLPRRTVLGALGAVGLGSAAAGLGTSAFFSDTETFTGNTLVAGELDLLVDFQEHYSDWSPDEAAVVSDVQMPSHGEETIDPADVMDGYVGLPTAEEPLIAVPEADLAAYWTATSIDAFPDDDGDGVQDEVPFDDECNYLKQRLRDVDGNWVSALDSSARTTAYRGNPLIELDDVKPGDFGEVTFSLHLCDNPGYIWVNGRITEDLDNTLTEPEADDEDEVDGLASGELGDAMRAALWYDTGLDGLFAADDDPNNDDDDAGEGDNIKQVFDPETGEGERLIIRGSLNDVMAFFGEGLGVPLDGNPKNGLLGGGGGVPVDDDDETNGSSIGTVGPGDAASSDLIACATWGGNPKCSDIRSDLKEATKQDVNDAETALVQSGLEPSGGEIDIPNVGKVTVHGYDVDGGTVTLSTDFVVAAVITKGGPNATVCKANADEDSTPLEPGDGVKLDNATFRTPINPKNGTPYGLSHFDVCVGITGGNGEVPPQEVPGRDCFPASDTAYLGFAWWLPVDHANEIQTDSIAFDLGFYTEQCRHNDGTGQAPEQGVDV